MSNLSLVQCSFTRALTVDLFALLLLIVLNDGAYLA